MSEKRIEFTGNINIFNLLHLVNCQFTGLFSIKNMNGSTPLLGSGIGFGRYGQYDISGLAAFGRQGQPSGILRAVLDRSFPVDIYLKWYLHRTALGRKRVFCSPDCQSRSLSRCFGRLSRSFSGPVRIFSYRIIFFTAPCEDHSCKKKQRTKFLHTIRL